MSTSSSTSFIHFGCWNNANVKTKSGVEMAVGCLDEVMQKLQDHLKENPAQFILVAGDNYYPAKRKTDTAKHNVIYPEKLIAGFQKLPKTVPVYMILGNRDLETNGTDQPKLMISGADGEKIETDGSCAIIKAEISAAKDANVTYTFFRAEAVSENTLLLMFDTNIFSKNANKYIPCYDVFLKETSNETISNINSFNSVRSIFQGMFKSFQTSSESPPPDTKEPEANPISSPENRVNELRQRVETLIMKAIADFESSGKKIKHLILSGHQPIYGRKLVDGQLPPLQSDIPFLNPVLHRIYEHFEPTTNSEEHPVSYYYLCADVHLYQKGMVHLSLPDTTKVMHIQQYIAGTGGAKLDTNIILDDGVQTEQYTIEESIAQCGFVEVTITGTGPSFAFIPVDSSIQTKTNSPQSTPVSAQAYAPLSPGSPVTSPIETPDETSAPSMKLLDPTTTSPMSQSPRISNDNIPQSVGYTPNESSRMGSNSMQSNVSTQKDTPQLIIGGGYKLYTQKYRRGQSRSRSNIKYARTHRRPTRKHAHIKSRRNRK